MFLLKFFQWLLRKLNQVISVDIDGYIEEENDYNRPLPNLLNANLVERLDSKFPGAANHKIMKCEETDLDNLGLEIENHIKKLSDVCGDDLDEMIEKNPELAKQIEELTELLNEDQEDDDPTRPVGEDDTTVPIAGGIEYYHVGEYNYFSDSTNEQN